MQCRNLSSAFHTRGYTFSPEFWTKEVDSDGNPLSVTLCQLNSNYISQCGVLCALIPLAIATFSVLLPWQPGALKVELLLILQ